jgi:ABC-type uncharacterized transport system ATPase component
MNKLLEKIQSKYRFNEDYYIQNGRSEVESILLNDINNNESREMNVLSDGERCLFSLIISSYAIQNSKCKILLLDEFDALLNPSLIKDFYEILYEYYLKVGIYVIIVTHSITTIIGIPESIYVDVNNSVCLYELTNTHELIEKRYKGFSEFAVSNDFVKITSEIGFTPTFKEISENNGF